MNAYLDGLVNQNLKTILRQTRNVIRVAGVELDLLARARQVQRDDLRRLAVLDLPDDKLEIANASERSEHGAVPREGHVDVF